MAMERRSTPYGKAAYAALRDALQHLQAGDPLTPVTVIVHSNAVGVAARRWLAAHGGVAAAQFLTAFRMAELLGGPALAGAGRRPVSTPVIDVAVRRVLQRKPGVFAPIAAHQATITALRDASRDLRHLDPEVVQRIATGSERASEVVRVHHQVEQMLRGEWYDEADLLRVAAAQSGPSVPTRTIVFLPQRTRPTELALFDMLARHGEVLVLEGDGAEPIDADTLTTVDTSDADEEVREAVRTIAAAVHDGTPLHRIAVVWPADDPYARLVAEHLDEALLPWNGRSGTAVHERLVPRLVLDLLRLDRRGIRRADLFALLASVPARDSHGDFVPRQWWERISRITGLAGDADWDRRLPDFAAAQGPEEFDQQAAAQALALQSFVADLRVRLGAADQSRLWSQWAQTAHDLVRHWLGPRGTASLPQPEVDAYETVQAALDRLANLDQLAGPATRAVFADTLEAELDGSPGRVGRIGTGVHAGPLSFAVGQCFDLVVVLGACEGLMPGRPPSEAVLSDADRSLANGALALAADRIDEQKAQLWAVLAGAQRAVITFPRGDLRATATRQPSRWLRELVGPRPIPARRVHSFASGLAEAAFPATLGQHRVRSLQHATRAGVPFADTTAAAHHTALARGAAMIAARRSNVLTEYDGDLSGTPIDALGTRPVSPTRLEKWVRCPFGWFVEYVLGVRQVEQPGEQLQISAKDRGTLVHEALHIFHQAVVDGDLPQPGPQGWTQQHLQALLAAFEQVGAAKEHLGLVGRTAFWVAEQSRQRHELATWMARDSVRLVERGAKVVASEHHFGIDDLPPAIIVLPDGEEVRLLGSVDRIDRCADNMLVVVDHKTGGADSYRPITDDDPTAGGTLFQLPTYAAAALVLTGSHPDTPVLAEYGFFAKGNFQRIGTRLTPQQWPGVGADLAHVVGGIRSGLFLARPEKSQFRLSFVKCPYCDPDGLGTAERWAEFDRKQSDPRVRALFATEAEDD